MNHKGHFSGQLMRERIHISKTLEEAFTSATNDSVAGDCILLAPACASFDQFKDFEERGKKFISLVENLKN